MKIHKRNQQNIKAMFDLQKQITVTINYFWTFFLVYSFIYSILGICQCFIIHEKIPQCIQYMAFFLNVSKTRIILSIIIKATNSQSSEMTVEHFVGKSEKNNNVPPVFAKHNFYHSFIFKSLILCFEDSQILFTSISVVKGW